MSFITDLNKYEANLLEDILNKQLDVSMFFEQNYIDILKTQFQEIYLLLLREDKTDATVEFIKYKVFKITRKYRKIYDISDTLDRKLNKYINERFIQYEEDARNLCNNNVELQNCKRRIRLTVKRINNIKNDISSSMLVDLNSIVRDVAELLPELKCEDRLYFKEEKVKLDKNFEYKNIYDYKDMCKLAIENGYVWERTSGDHLIYKHSQSCRIIIIPAHSLKRGLSLSIQKQIEVRKVV